MTKTLYDLGETPPVGVVPEKMHAWLVRQDRFGEPKSLERMQYMLMNNKPLRN